MKKADVIIVGAGAAGLMAARELSKAGKKVIILEARDRIGGRIMPLDEKEFGYPAQGGAEFVHGEAPITRALIKEAGLTFISQYGEVWSARSGELCLQEQFTEHNDLLKQKLQDLKKDISIFDFLEQNFIDERDSVFKNSVIKMVEGYDAADPKLVSTFVLRDEWLGKEDEWEAGWIKEGYGALINFLHTECTKYGVEILLNNHVASVELKAGDVDIRTKHNEIFEASQIIVTVPLPVLKDIKFNPDLKEKLNLIPKIGFGNAIRVIMRFKTRWWEHALGKDLSKMSFLLSNEKFLTWWSLYPELNPVLIGWMAGPKTVNYKNSTEEELQDVALTSLSNILKINKDTLAKEIVASRVIDWQNDPFAKGAYSYTTIYTGNSYQELAKPIDNTIFFAGESFFSTGSTSTVEAALGSGMETAKKILDM